MSEGSSLTKESVCPDCQTRTFTHPTVIDEFRVFPSSSVPNLNVDGLCRPRLVRHHHVPILRPRPVLVLLISRGIEGSGLDRDPYR